jgi:hypothetical protein
MYCNESELRGESTVEVSKCHDPSDDRQWTAPVAVLPTRTKKQAKKLCQFANLSQEEQVNLLIRWADQNPINSMGDAAAFTRYILDCIGFGEGGK